MSESVPAPEPQKASLSRTISLNVRSLMSQRNVSQQQLANAIGLPQTGVSKRLRGATHWNAPDIQAVAEAFDVPWSRLVEPMEEGDAPAPLRVVAHPIRSRRVTQHTRKYPTLVPVVTVEYGRAPWWTGSRAA